MVTGAKVWAALIVLGAALAGLWRLINGYAEGRALKRERRAVENDRAKRDEGYRELVDKLNGLPDNADSHFRVRKKGGFRKALKSLARIRVEPPGDSGDGRRGTEADAMPDSGGQDSDL